MSSGLPRGFKILLALFRKKHQGEQFRNCVSYDHGVLKDLWEASSFALLRSEQAEALDSHLCRS